MRALAIVFLLFILVPTAPAHGQQVSVAVAPDTITVGEVARVGVRVVAPAGAEVSLPDTLPITGELENAGRPEVTVATNADGSRSLTATYPITAWRPGVDTLPVIEVGIEIDGRAAVSVVALPVLVVASVLPADTAGIEAKPPHDVIGPAWVWWLWALLGLLILAALALLAWWLIRRRRNRPVVLGPVVSARERALGELAAIRAERMHDRPSIDPFYERVSAVLRGYLSDTDPRWGRYRTTSELTAALLPAASPEVAARLRALLREADSVKFAAALPDARAAERHLDEVRAWIEGFPPPPPTVQDEPERAA